MLTLNPDDLNTLRVADESLNQQVVHLIGAKIVSGELPEGASLQKEAELGELIGVSRTVIREAIKVLASKGLLSSRQKAGIMVSAKHNWNLFDPDILDWLLASGLDRDLLINLTELRLAFEPTVASIVAARAPADAITPLRDALTMMQAATTQEAYYLADLAFHDALICACPNAFLRQLKSVIHVLLKGSFKLQQHSSDRAEGTALHAKVLASIEAHDSERAEATMRFLILEAREEIFGLFPQLGV